MSDGVTPVFWTIPSARLCTCISDRETSIFNFKAQGRPAISSSPEYNYIKLMLNYGGIKLMFTGNINFTIKINVYAIYNRLENPLKQDIRGNKRMYVQFPF